MFPLYLLPRLQVVPERTRHRSLHPSEVFSCTWVNIPENCTEVGTRPFLIAESRQGVQPARADLSKWESHPHGKSTVLLLRKLILVLCFTRRKPSLSDRQ